MEKQKDLIRRRTRRRVGNAGIYKCGKCKRFRYRQDMEAHHKDYSGYCGSYVMLCKECHKGIKKGGFDGKKQRGD